MDRLCWPTDDPLMIDYHDREWGIPVRDDKKLFGKLVLDGFQAGLSWSIILRKRDAFLRAFEDFDPERIARWKKPRIEKLMKDAGIVRNRAKIEGAVQNARAYLALPGSFSELLWSFVGGQPKINRWKTLRQLPASSTESEAMSKALKKAGFTFCGPTICYAFMQAVGMVNDHLVGCPRYLALASVGGGPPAGSARRGGGLLPPV